ncbi:MAG TPA: hypothetical protein VMQ10_07300, partial [Spirochaetia bacterium]|nr:hypothetical protein [Spirochaetia bacterium]
LDRRERRDVVLVYGAASEDELAFREVFDEAERTIGLRPVYVMGLVTAQVLREVLPDAARRQCFVSGPPVMMDATTSALRSVGVRRTSIRTDFFPGYAADERDARAATERLPSGRRAFG